MLLHRVRLAFVAICSSTIVSADPAVSLPISAQIPPAAIVLEAYRFEFSPNTFLSSHPIQYSLEEAPDWLRLENNSRVLTGLPSSSDVGTIYLKLVASDEDGNVSLDFKLLVVEKNQLRPQSDFIEYIQRAGKVSAPATLILPPQTYFTLSLDSAVFVGSSGTRYYYATSSSRTPLPAWIVFNSKTISFSGTTPSLLTEQSSPQTFNFLLSGSLHEGFSQATIEFEISITNNVLYFTKPVQSYSLSGDQQLFLPSFLKQLFRDGSPIERSQIAQIVCNPPEWLSLNYQDLSLSGRSPNVVQPIRFSLTITDDKNNVANATIEMDTIDPNPETIKNIDLGTENATMGEHFSYSLDSKMVQNRDICFTINYGEARTWLTFIEANRTLSGTVPHDIPQEEIQLLINIQDGQGFTVNEHVVLSIVKGTSTADSSASNVYNSKPTLRNSSSNSDDDKHSKSDHNSKKILVLWIATPILVGILFAVAAVLLCKKMRERKRHGVEPNLMHPGPLNPIGQQQDSEDQASAIMPSRTSDSSVLIGNMSSISPIPPRLELPLSTHHQPFQQLRLPSGHTHGSSPSTSIRWNKMLRDLEDSRNQYTFSRSVAESSSQQGEIIVTKTPNEGGPASREIATSSVQRVDFGRRRSQGLGHGLVRNLSISNVVGMTLRKVPLSPLTDSARSRQASIESTLQHSYNQHHIRKDLLAHNGFNHKAFPRLNEQRRILHPVASSESRFDDPPESVKQSDSTTQSHGSDEVSDSPWEDENWSSESNVSHTIACLWQRESRTSSSNNAEVSREFVNDTTQASLLAGTSSRTLHSPNSHSSSVRFV